MSAQTLPDGYSVPLHRSLTEVILLGGAPRMAAILNGTLAAALGLGLQMWGVGLVYWIVSHGICVWSAMSATEAICHAEPFRIPRPPLHAGRLSALGGADRPRHHSEQGGVFFTVRTGGSPGDLELGQRPVLSRPANDPFAALASLSEATAGTGFGTDPNRQDRKEAFLQQSADGSIYNPHRLETPLSPYQVMAGTVISATLLTGINSDLPGQVIAQVTEPVYDTVSGEHLLIPQGSRVIGRYDSVIAYGQSRALIVWNRIIMPDGSSIRIENLPATDVRGYAGLSDQVDHHTLRLFSAAALSSLISVGAELSEDDDERVARALRDAVQDGASRVGEEVVRRQLAVQPTITIRPGWRLRIIVSKDLIIGPKT